MEEIFRHFRNGKEYSLLGEGIYGKPRTNGDFDPLFEIVYDADSEGEPQLINVYLGRTGYVFDSAQLQFAGMQGVLYISRENVKGYPAGTLWVRHKQGFFGEVCEEGYQGPRFIQLSD